MFGLVQTGLTALFSFLWGKSRARNKQLEERVDKIEARLDNTDEINRISLFRDIDEDYENCMNQQWISTNRLKAIHQMANAFKSTGPSQEEIALVDCMVEKMTNLEHRRSM